MAWPGGLRRCPGRRHLGHSGLPYPKPARTVDGQSSWRRCSISARQRRLQYPRPIRLCGGALPGGHRFSLDQDLGHQRGTECASGSTGGGPSPGPSGRACSDRASCSRRSAGCPCSQRSAACPCPRIVRSATSDISGTYAAAEASASANPASAPFAGEETRKGEETREGEGGLLQHRRGAHHSRR
jgi:hypothetical protein